MLLHRFLILLADTALPLDGTSGQTPPQVLPTYEGAFLKMVITLAALIIGLIGTVWFLKKLWGGRLGGGSTKSVQILEKKALSSKTMLYLLEVEGKQVVISESQLEVKRLASFATSLEKET